jgi:hypothetical protein
MFPLRNLHGDGLIPGPKHRGRGRGAPEPGDAVIRMVKIGGPSRVGHEKDESVAAVDLVQ